MARTDELPEQSAGGEVIARLADELLPMLIARLDASRLGELEVRQNGWRIRLRRPAHNDGPAAVERERADRGREAARTTERAPAGQRAETGSAGSRPERANAVVSSPAVGYFLPRDGLTPGMALRDGDVIGHVDVLGVRQEVVVRADSMLSRLEVEPGQAVEYGEPIARLEEVHG